MLHQLSWTWPSFEVLRDDWGTPIRWLTLPQGAFMHMLRASQKRAFLRKLNPRRQDLFLAEDFIGKVKRVGKKCHKRLVSLRAAQRRVILMATKWAKMRGE